MLMVIWLIFVLITSTAASIDKCSHHTKPGEICKLDIDKVRPTQAAVGMAEVRCKRVNLVVIINSNAISLGSL